jgi:hypothetical protein
MAIYGMDEGAGLEIPLLLSNPEEYFKQVYKLGTSELDAKKKLLEKIRGWLAKQEISSTRAKCRTMIFHNATSLWQSRTPTFDTSKVQSLDLTNSVRRQSKSAQKSMFNNLLCKVVQKVHPEEWQGQKATVFS